MCRTGCNANAAGTMLVICMGQASGDFQEWNYLNAQIKEGLTFPI